MRLLRLTRSVLEYLTNLSVFWLILGIMCRSQLPENLSSFSMSVAIRSGEPKERTRSHNTAYSVNKVIGSEKLRSSYDSAQFLLTGNAA